MLIISSAWIGKIVNAITTLLVIRFISTDLGLSFASIFIVLTGLLGWYAVVDLGLGSSIQNFISEAKASGQPYEDYLTLARLIGAALLIIGIGTCYLLSPIVGKILLANFTILDGTEMAMLFFISASLYVAMTIGSIGYKIWYAEHRGYLANTAPAIGAVLGAVLVYMVQFTNYENKILVCLIAFLSPPACFALASLFYRGQFNLQVTKINWINASKVFRRSSGFFYMTLTQAFIVNIDYVILARFGTSQDIVAYGIISRVFGFAAFFYTSIYSGLWPQFTELIVKKNWKPVKKMLLVSYLFSVCIILCFTFFVIAMQKIIEDFLAPNQNIEVPTSLIILLAAYHIVIAWVHGLGIVMQSMSDTKPFIFWLPIQAFINIVLQTTLVPIFGLHGLIAGMLLSFLLTLVWILPLRVQKYICIH